MSFTSDNERGAVRCGIQRHPVIVESLSAQSFYDACTKMKGNMYTMGSLYNSIWYNAYQEAVRLNKQDDFIKLYFEVLAVIDGNDDFLTMHEKIQRIDAEKFQGQFSGIFAAELVARGLGITLL